MNPLNVRTFAAAVGVVVLGGLLVAPSTTRSARADDDDWEDRWEDYYEELEDRREEAEERWEERRERIEDLREKGIFVPYDGWHEHNGPYNGHFVYRHPSPRYYPYYDRPRHHAHYDVPPPYAYRYEAYPRVYRYYGTPDIGYYDSGRGGAVRIGPIQVFWD